MSLTQNVRLIGGRWRGRKLTFPEQDQLRPTLGRTRETMFNWCQSFIAGSHCLDLFAGSGAMGFEALSRGAASVVMVDKNQEVVNFLNKNKQMLGAERAKIVRAQVPCASELLGSKPFDVVFLDPPFGSALHQPILNWLNAKQLLVDGAAVICEWGLQQRPRFPIIYEILREKKAGQVGYGFLQYNQGQKIYE